MAETIPPSIAMLVLGSVTPISIGTLFVAGLLPAAVIAACLMGLIWLTARRDAAGPDVLQGRRFAAIPSAILPLAMPVMMVAGIRFGIATPTEVSTFAVLYGVALSTVVYRALPLRRVLALAMECGATAGMVLFVLASASSFAWTLTAANLPQDLVALLDETGRSPAVFLVGSIVMLILIGTLLEGLPALIILAPLLMPLAGQLGINQRAVRRRADPGDGRRRLHAAGRHRLLRRLRGRRGARGDGGAHHGAVLGRAGPRHRPDRFRALDHRFGAAASRQRHLGASCGHGGWRASHDDLPLATRRLASRPNTPAPADASMPPMTNGPSELLTPVEMGQADRAAIAGGLAGTALMENAGRAVARAIRARFAPCRTLVLCGPGNNGGDGYVAARHLQQAGWPVGVAALGEPHGDAAWAARSWNGPAAAFSVAAASRAGLVVDAVFGAGLSRDVEPSVAAVLGAARRVVAIDVPSGVDGATGGVLGQAPACALTVTFFRLKPGHLLLPGRTLCGETVLADIAIPSGVLAGIGPRTFRNGPALWSVPRPGPDSHKYTRGHVTILGGPAMTGAARMAARSARRGGAGMVTIAAGEGAAIYQAGDPGVIVDARPLGILLTDKRRNVFVCGPGLGADGARASLPMLLDAARAGTTHLVVDADALTVCAGEPDRLRGASVVTPHAGEFARVFGEAGADRLAAARAAAARTGAVVLLKGSDTIVAAPDGRAAINDTAPPTLATAGAGDVLAGLVGAFLGQGMPAWEAACAAVWVHGRAAELVGNGLIAEDIAEMVPRAIATTIEGAAASTRGRRIRR